MPNNQKKNKPKELTAGGSGSRFPKNKDGSLRMTFDEGGLSARTDWKPSRDSDYYVAGLIDALARRRAETVGTPENRRARQEESRRAAGNLPRGGKSKPKATPRGTRVAK